MATAMAATAVSDFRMAHLAVDSWTSMNMSTVLLLRLPVKARTAVLPPAGQRTAHPWLIGSGHSAEQAEEWIAQLPAWTATDRQVLDDFASKNATKWATKSRQKTERRVRDFATWTGEWADRQTDGHQSAPSHSAGHPGDVGAGAALPPQWKLADTGYLMTTTYRADSDTTPPSPYTARLQTSGDVVTAIVLDLEGYVAASGRLTTADAFGIVDQVETAPAHRSRGLGNVVVRSLAPHALRLDADTGVLVATDDGHRLYRALGWTVRTPVAAAYIPEPRST
ncbi:GNAT family N-acetyltransferase [Micromonospora noduli]|uniref:GNAT family N-acetyltransferase n=1 Tax=Micromonospora noduli TaxID=709876 RepID=UPI0034304188